MRPAIRCHRLEEIMNHRKLFSLGLALATVLSLAAPLASFAQEYDEDADFTSQRLVIPRIITPDAWVPTLVVPPNTGFRFYLDNPTETQAVIRIPDQGIEQYIWAARNHQVVHVDMSAPTTVRYTVEELDGGLIASGILTNQEPPPNSVLVTDPSTPDSYVLSYEGKAGSRPHFGTPIWKELVIAAAPVRVIPRFEFQQREVIIPPPEPEPAPPVRRQEPVRGYW